MAHGAIAVVGLGVCSPAGSTETAFWNSLLSAKAQTEQFDHELLRGRSITIASVAEPPYETTCEPHELRRIDRPHVLAFSAFSEAVRGLDLDALDRSRVGVSVGTGYGAGPASETQANALRTGGARAVSPLLIPLSMPNSVAGHLSIAYNLTGPAVTYCTACSAGATAIGEAMWLLRSGRVDLVVAGGVDSLTFATPLSGFLRLGALSAVGISRPFDAERDGFVMGEGAGFVALMRAADAAAEGRPVLGSLLGYGTTSDAYHLVAPDPSGRSASECMRYALADAGVEAGDVSHVNAHGTSTRLNDLAESEAIRQVFGEHRPPVTASKGVTGHLIGASGAVELVATVLSIRHGLAPPVGGLEHVDPEVSADIVVGEPRLLSGGPAVSNSFAFGGHNVSLVVG